VPGTDYYVEATPPLTRKPPVVETGALGWLRENLFSSWASSLLSVITAAVLIWALAAALRWAVQQANWAVITSNLQLFALGRYPQDQAWRPLIGAAVLMFLIGLAWRLWGRAGWAVVAVTAAGLALLFVFPAVATGLPIPDAHLLIGGPSTEPLPAMAYTAQQGQTVTFTLRPTLFDSPPPKGFIDSGSLTVYGLGRQNVRAAGLQAERARAAGEEPPPVTPPDLVATVILRDSAGETLATLTAGPAPEPATLAWTFPEDGWYLLDLGSEGGAGGFWLDLSAIMPLSTAGAEVEARQALYGPPPALEGRRVRVMDTALLGFQGQATLSDYVKLHLGPISLALRDFALLMTAVTAAGYGLGALIRGRSWARRAALIAWAISPVLIFILILGVEGSPALPVVNMERWGGLLLTMTLTVVGIVAAFPIGVLLALGRRSELPVVRLFCTLAIELVRGVPLVTILFMASLLVPLLDPRLSSVDNVIRAMFGITFFSAAYLAEIVRGGLQAVPYGQTEAAKALGMPGWQITGLIVLPQALRAVIPAIMGQFVSLFKDTSLVLIIGLLDLLGIARSVINQAEYIGLQRETLVFISVIYFVISYLMSWVSRRLEATGSGAVRRG